MCTCEIVCVCVFLCVFICVGIYMCVFICLGIYVCVCSSVFLCMEIGVGVGQRQLYRHVPVC